MSAGNAEPPTAGSAVPPVSAPSLTRPASSARAAALVGAGILLSRILGLVRQRVFAYYFGTTDAGDAFTQAFRIPNFLQNLFGEGVLSASFIPVYARLRARGDDDARREVAGAIFSILFLTGTLLVAAGIFFAPQLTTLITPGWSGEKHRLTVQLVRILFPGAAIFVLSAWSLGVLNSHGRFFLSYASAVLWNVAMIVTLIVAGAREELPALAVWLSWGSVAGAALQLLVQLPGVFGALGAIRVGVRTLSPHTREVVRNFFPVFVGRGVTQLSAFVDSIIASLLVTGSVTVLNYAQLLYMLPVSLFGMSVTAAELPAMSSAVGDDASVAAQLRERLQVALRRIAFFIVPSAVAFVTAGDLVASLVYQNGRFGRTEAVWVWGTLAGSAVGLLASTSGRLYASVFYALRDTRTPLRFAVLRVTLTGVLGLVFALVLPGLLGLAPRWGVAGLTASAGLAGWVEYALLRRAAAARIGPLAPDGSHLPRLWLCAAAAGLTGWGARLTTNGLPPLVHAVLVLGVFGATYLGVTHRAGLSESGALLRRLRRR